MKTYIVANGGSSDQGSLTGAIQTNLFIDEVNQEKGLLDPMSVQDAFTWLINKQKFQVLKDERFTLYPNVAVSKNQDSTVLTSQGPNGITKSQRFKKYYLPVPKNKWLQIMVKDLQLILIKYIKGCHRKKRIKSTI